MNDNFKPLLSMLNGYYGIVDRKTRIIKKVYKVNELFCENVDINAFLDLIEDREHLVPSSYDRSMLVPWVLKNTLTKSVAVTFASKDNKEKKYKIRIYDDEALPEFYFYIYKPTNEIESFSLFDKLTRIYLREGIETIIQNELESKEKRLFTLIIIDVDNFKTINDMYGHLFGDHILVEISTMLKGFSNNCQVGRIGGDEFLIIDYTSQDYDSLWNKLHTLLEKIRYYDYVKTYNSLDQMNIDKDFRVTVTAGVTNYPKDGETFEALFLKADKALYRGKRKGRNCYIIYDDVKHKNISVDKSIEFDSPTSRELLIYEKLIYNGLLILDNDGTVEYNIQKYIELFGNYIKADRVVLYKHCEAFKDKLVAGYCNPNIELASDKYLIKEVEESNDSKYMDLLQTYKRSKIDVLKELKPGIYDFLHKQNVKSFIQLPISKKGILYGFLRFDSVLEEHKWREEELTLYNIMADCLSNYITSSKAMLDYEYAHERDSLTGLASYNSSLEKITSLLSKERKSVCIGVTDLFNFRLYNDTYGYSTGDNVIRVIARTLSNANLSFLGRLNGDHFVFVSDVTTISDIEELVNKISKDFTNGLSGISGEDMVKMRFGLYITNSIETNARACIDKARLAILELMSKKDQTYLIYDTKLNDEFKARRDILDAYKKEINENKLEIFLQPKVNAKTNKLVGAEALSRWKKDDGTYWPPSKYIQILENENEIASLDLYNIEQILKYQSKLIEQGKKLFPISLNISKHQTDILGFADKVENLRKKYNIEHKYLQIEITETAFENNYDQCLNAIKKFKAFGYTICMDDFGVGYSNLELLASGLFDIIKFDKTLIDKTDKFGHAVFKYSINLVKSLGLTIVFEGVETEEQVDYVIKNGGRIIQGYYYSKPISLTDFNEKFVK